MSRNDSGVGLYARRLRRRGPTLPMETALIATGLRTRAGQVKAIEDMRTAGLVEVEGNIVTVKATEHTGRGPGRKPSINGRCYRNERPGYREKTRNGPVRVRSQAAENWAGGGIMSLTDDEVAERLAGVSEITDEGEVIETGLKVLVAPEDESYD